MNCWVFYDYGELELDLTCGGRVIDKSTKEDFIRKEGAPALPQEQSLCQ
jgi:hypothetical protein